MSVIIILDPDPEIQDAVSAALNDLPKAMGTANAVAIMYAITLQEDPGRARRQIIKRDGKLVAEGPAKGLWQFELGGGCVGVLRDRASRQHALSLCYAHKVEPTARALWDALQHNDALAAGIARLLLWTDHEPLPHFRSSGAEETAWQIYLRTWRPGAYHNGDGRARAALRAKWSKNWAVAAKAVTAHCEAGRYRD